jgi:hypothetical protein
VIREHDDGRRDVTVVVAVTMHARARVGASLTVNSATPQSTQAQEYLARAITSRHLTAVLDIWANPVRTWPRLYRIVEEIEAHLGQSVANAGYWSAAERKQFLRSANSAEVAGVDARHALGPPAPSNPMTFADAERLVAQALQSVLAR